MNKTTLNNIKKAHFIGIGGISMSGLAQTLHSKGIVVSGSDIADSALTEQLENIGICVSIGHESKNVPADCQLVTYTAALSDDNPELLQARAYGIEVIDRAELLGLIMDDYKRAVGVSGTHGKTTTTSLISETLLEAGYDPTLNVGGIIGSIDSNFRVGKSEYFVAEACEYFDSFSKFYPYIGVILNIDNDHTDYFKSEEQLRNSFKTFAGNIPADGFLIINNDIRDVQGFIAGLKCNVVTYGTDGEYSAANIEYSSDGRSSFDIYHKGAFVARMSLNLPGAHNVENSLAAFAAGSALGVPVCVMQKSFAAFSGAKRRFETKGYLDGIHIVDDYAHHPTEINATLAAAKKCKHEKIYTVFQPHTFSRTKSFLNDFAKALSVSDTVVLLDIYSAREADDGSVHSRDVAAKIKELGTPCFYFESFDKAGEFLKSSCQKGDMIITMGAGDVYKLGEELLWQK